MSAVDRPTRGRTSRGRLRALDAFILHREPHLLLHERNAPFRAAVIDVGLGETPWTTLEMAAAFRGANPELEVLGVESDDRRAKAAVDFLGEAAQVVRGGLDELGRRSQSVRLVRAMNLLRAYPPMDVPALHAALAAPLVEGGLLIEGSSDSSGGVLSAHLLRRRGPTAVREALLFYTDFSRGFAPRLFRDWLPRDLRRRVVPGQPLHAFFAAWTEAWEQARAAGARELAAAFAESARGLGARVEGVELDGWLLERGYLLWRPRAGVPAPRG